MSFVRWKTGRLIKATPHNVQVTVDRSTKNARSESCVATSPGDPRQIVCASKRFRDGRPSRSRRLRGGGEPTSYEFVIAANYSTDGGVTWAPSSELELLKGSENNTDPAVAWAGDGNVYLMTLPLAAAPELLFFGVAIYRSSDGGATWGPPKLIHHGADDKGWLIANRTGGGLYAAWDDVRDLSIGSLLRFARMSDGATWSGVGPTAAGEHLFPDDIRSSFSPTLCTLDDGTLVIAWVSRTTIESSIQYVKSSDGGQSFTGPFVAASDITPVEERLELIRDGNEEPWSVLPGASFRLSTIATCCSVGNSVLIAWPDARESVGGKPVTRIYHQTFSPRRPERSPSSGDPLLGGEAAVSGYRFAINPQLAITEDGTIGCAYYEYMPNDDETAGLIDVVLATSDVAATFRAGRVPYSLASGPQPPLNNRLVITDRPWDPAVDAPWAHKPNDAQRPVTFIGDYFGLDAQGSAFDVVWTDTRTGIQELFAQRVAAEVLYTKVPDRMVDILFGIIQDGGGLERLKGGGIVIHVPPRGPARELLAGYTISDLARGLSSPTARTQIEVQASNLEKRLVRKLAAPKE